MSVVLNVLINGEPCQVELVSDEVQRLFDSGFISPQAILEGTWEAVCNAGMTLEEARKDSLVAVAFRLTGADDEAWFNDLAATIAG